jgi:hypothetical protein
MNLLLLIYIKAFNLEECNVLSNPVGRLVNNNINGLILLQGNKMS